MESETLVQQASHNSKEEVTRLNKMLDQISKQVQWTFPQWRVTD